MASSVYSAVMKKKDRDNDSDAGSAMGEANEAPMSEKRSFSNFFKKASSIKSGGSGNGGGPQSVITSLSDLERIEKIMNQA